MPTQNIQDNFTNKRYTAGFSTDIDSFIVKPGLNEEIIRYISTRKKEPDYMLKTRLEAFKIFQNQQEPAWGKLNITPIDLQSISYYAAPKSMKDRPQSLDEVDAKLLETYNKLGIPLAEQKLLAGVAVDAVFDSVSVITTFKDTLKKAGVIFCPISEAIIHYPDLVKKYLHSVVPLQDNYYATLNSAVFTDGSFVYIPKNTKCPLELSTYFRINALNTGQFERTLIIADEGSYVSYLEGCTAPMRDENQLHAAVVELIAEKGAHIKYSTVQNWYPGDQNGKGGIYNFVTKRGLCQEKSGISWTQIETGSAITWKYPSVILRGNDSTGEFYSVALTNNYQQADTGTKMIHIGKNTSSTVISKGISAMHSSNAYRGLIRIAPTASASKNFTQCDSLILSDTAKAHTYPYMDVQRKDADIAHEATTSNISDDQFFYTSARGLDAEKAATLIVNGFCRQVFKKLPLEFAVEAGRLMEVSLEGAIG